MTKVALVTGASSGIGESIALHLVESGWTVYAVARRVERMAALETRGVITFAMDVTDDASMVAGIDRIITEQGQIDALVNNAGYGSYGPVEHVPLDEARRQFEVNVFGLARLTQLVIPHMRTRRRGRIVNISSIGGKIYEPLGAWYHATKFAVEGFSDSLRVELAPFGIDVVVIEPGPIISEWNTIARDNMVEHSVGTVYEDLARRMAVMFERIDTPRMSSGPEAVAEKVLKALEAANPATRYPAGRGARAIVTARRLLPDRALDVVLKRAYSR
ncbi:MAG TPA: oxidoreductase [Terrabacter sp.]|nr:oxidoreductase [Terrabacter sp.]